MRFRLGSHSFMVERGRWLCPKFELIARLLDECDEIEDEFYVVFICPRYNNKYRIDLDIHNIHIKGPACFNKYIF